MWTQVIWKNFTKKFPNKVDFPDVIFNFSKLSCSLPSTYCLTGELWPLRFSWHYDLRVTHCHSSSMTFVFTQYSSYIYLNSVFTNWTYEQNIKIMNQGWRPLVNRELPFVAAPSSPPPTGNKAWLYSFVV